jgi:hypothetical protein
MADMTPPTTAEVLLTALAGVTACEAGLPLAEIAAIGEESPGYNFAGAAALAARLAAEVRALGGDPDAILRGVYGACAPV